MGGCTFSRNRTGSYIRRKVVPTNPASSFQTEKRGRFASLVILWTTVLTPTQRASWDSWANATEQSGWGGKVYKMTGQNAYIAMNTMRLERDYGPINEPPPHYSSCQLTPPVITKADVSDQEISFNINVADEWAILDNAGLCCYVGRPQNPSVNYFKGPYRFAFAFSGSGGNPLTNPRISSTPFHFALGQRVFCQFRAQAEDGRISVATRSTIIAVA